VENPACSSLQRAATEALSVGLGFGVLGFNRLQVHRREWEKTTGHSLPSPTELATTVSTMVSALASLVTERGRR